jgi:hypothetical protein
MKQHKKSKDVNCPVCQKVVKARGLKPHLRLLHHLEITTVVEKNEMTKENTKELHKNNSSHLSEFTEVTIKKHVVKQIHNPHAHTNGDFMKMIDFIDKNNTNQNTIEFWDINSVP